MPGNEFYGAIEALSAAVVPVAGGLVAAIRWRKSAQQNRTAREEAARIAAQGAADAARAEVQAEREKTAQANAERLRDRDATIVQLREELATERAENAVKDQTIMDLLRGQQKPPVQGATP